MTEGIEYTDAVLRVGGEAKLDNGLEFEHDHEVYVVARARVVEVAFPEKDGEIKRVHKAKLVSVQLASPEDAQRLIDKANEARTGQSSIFSALEDTQEFDVEELAEVLAPTDELDDF